MVTCKRFSVWQVNLSPAQGSEQSGFRPVLIISPTAMNNHLQTVLVAPMTTTLRGWPTRVALRHDGKQGEVALDQIRTLDKIRLQSSMGLLTKKYHRPLLGALAELFAA